MTPNHCRSSRATLFLLNLYFLFSSHAAVDFRFYGNYLLDFPGEPILGTRVDQLLNSGDFPDGFVKTDLHAATPDFETSDGFITSGWLEWPPAGPRPNRIDSGPNTDTGDNYGGAFSGILYPPETGLYRFYVRSDDSSAIYLNVAGSEFLDPKDGAVEPIVEETGCCRALPEVFSDPIELVAGQGYAFEALWKEGRYGDYFELAWSFEDGPIELINAFYLQRDVRYGAPNADGITGGATTATAPVGLEDRPFPGLGVEFDKAGAATIRWEIDLGSGFVEIGEGQGFQGFHSPFLTAPISWVEWDGRSVRAVVDGAPGVPIVLNVQADTVPPQLSFLTEGTALGDRIRMVSDEPLDADSATNPDNYRIGTRSPSGITQVTPREFLLDFGELGSETFQIQVSGLTDQAAAKNEVNETFDVHFQNPNFEVYIFENALPRLSGSTKQRLVQNLERINGAERFPDMPDKTFSLEAALDIPQIDTVFGPPDRSDFVGYTFGQLVIDEPGDYTFAIRSDDSSAFFLSANASPENLPALDAPTVFEPDCCDPLGGGAPDSVRTINLAAGEYAFALYYFEFAFDDYVQVGWGQNDDDPFTPIPLSHIRQTINSGPLSFNIAPTDQAVSEGETAVFSGDVTGSSELALRYQWLEDGTPLEGAVAPTLSIPNVTFDNHGKAYELLAYNVDAAFDILRSDPVVLNVGADSDPPVIESIETSRHFLNTVTIQFNEPMDTGRSQTLANYSFTDGLVPIAATLMPDLRTLHLGLEDLPANLAFSITISGLTDRSVTANFLETVTFDLESPLFLATFDDVDLGPNVDELRDQDEAWTEIPPSGWTVDDSQMSSIDDPLRGTTEWEGWSFTDETWWKILGQHDRTLFTKASDVIAVADIDQWNDKGNAGLPGQFTAWMSTPDISVDSVLDPKLALTFDSSFIPDGAKIAVLRAQFDDDTPFEIFRWESSTRSQNYKYSSPNETLELIFLKPSEAKSLRLDFGVLYGQADLWWAIDSVELRPHIEREPPHLEVAGIGSALGDRVRVRADEPLDETSALDLATYIASGRDTLGVEKINDHEYWVDVGPFTGAPFEFQIIELADKSRFLNRTTATFQIDFRNPEFQFLYYDQATIPPYDSLSSLVSGIEAAQEFPTFPEFPFDAVSIIGSDFYLTPPNSSFPGPTGRLYGYASGWIEIPESGAYTFALRSQKQAAVYISADASLENIPTASAPTLFELGCCGEALQVGDTDAVETLELEAGNYAFETHHFGSANSSDFFELSWRRHDSAPFERIPVRFLKQVIETGSLTFPGPLDDVVALEGRSAKFSTLASGAPKHAIGYQWLKNGEVIPGANEPSLVLSRVTRDDDGSIFTLVAFNRNGALDEARVEATLSVTPDIAAPSITYTRMPLEEFPTIYVWFDEALDPVTAVNPNNFRFSHGIQIDEVQTIASNRQLRFRLREIPLGEDFTLEIGGIQDFASPPNIMGVQELTFSAPLFIETFDTLPLGPPIQGTIQPYPQWSATPPEGWSVDNSGVTSISDPLLGTPEWEGWAFANYGWWGQLNGIERLLHFSNGFRTIAVVDPGLWNLKGQPGFEHAFNATLTTLPILIEDEPAGSLSLRFSSAFESRAMTARIDAIYDERVRIPLVRWEGDEIGGPFSRPFHGVCPIGNPADATTVRFQFSIQNAKEDGWWALDTIALIRQSNIGTPVEGQSLTPRAGERVILQAQPLGPGPHEFQWHKNDAPLIGQNGPLLEFTSVSPERNSGRYHVTISQTDEPQINSRPFQVQVTGDLTLFEETFDSVRLGPTIDEPSTMENAWSASGPTGWDVDRSRMNPLGVDGVGRKEWEGWTFANSDWWQRSGYDVSDSFYDLFRIHFARAKNTLAVVDVDRWNRLGSPLDADGNAFVTTLRSPEIDISKIVPGSLYLEFDSSWRGTNDHRATVSVQYDDGPVLEITRWETTGVYEKQTWNADRHSLDETLVVSLDNPAGATSARVCFSIFKTGETSQDAPDWWAIDNIRVSGVANPSFGGFAGETAYMEVVNRIGTPVPGRLRRPNDIAIHPITQHIYVVDTENDRLQVFDEEGAFIQFFAPQFKKISGPREIAIDVNGNAYIRYSNGSLIRFSPEGEYEQTFESPARAFSIGPAGKIYLLSGADEVRVYDRNGVAQSVISLPYEHTFSQLHIEPNGNLVFNQTTHLPYTFTIYNSLGTPLRQTTTNPSLGGAQTAANGPDGDLYFATSKGYLISYNSEGTLQQTINLDDLIPFDNGIRFGAAGIVFDSLGQLLAVSPQGNAVYVFDLDDQVKHVIGRNGLTEPGQFPLRTLGLAFDRDGNLYATDEANHRIQVFDVNGDFSHEFGTPGLDIGEINRPNGIGITPEGDVAITEWGKFGIQLFRKNGEFVRALPTQSGGTLIAPRQLAFDAAGNIHTETPFRVHVFDRDGSNILSFGEENLERPTPVPGAFYFIQSIALDREDNIYANDSNLGSVQVFNSAGEFLRRIQPAIDIPEPVTDVGSIDIDDQNRLYLEDDSNDRILVCSTSGELLEIIDPRDFSPPAWESVSALAVRKNGEGLAVASSNGQICLLRRTKSLASESRVQLLETFDQAEAERAPLPPTVGNVLSQSGDLRIARRHFSNNQFLELSDTSESATAYLEYSIDSAARILRISFTSAIPTGGLPVGDDAFGVEISFEPNLGEPLRLLFGEDGKLFFGTNTLETLPFSWRFSKSYQVDLKFDRVAWTLSLSIDGETLLEDFFLPFAYEKVSALLFISNAATTGVWELDNLSALPLPRPRIDLTRNGRTDVGEIILLNRYLTENIRLDAAERSLLDLNQDGYIDAIDRELLILQTLE